MTEPGTTGSTATKRADDTPKERQRMIQHLDRVGLNLFASLSGQLLQEQKIKGLEDLESDVAKWGSLPLARQTFLLIGHAGPAFWSACQGSEQAREPDPVDQFTQIQVIEALKLFLPETDYRLLYPAADCRLPLQDLGAIAGWHRPSPLGIGIHPDAGLWFAYRALVLVDEEWKKSDELSPADLGVDHCVNCKTQDCISACPPSALGMGQAPDLLRCCQFRVESNSVCEKQCLARNACPVSPHQRYSQGQIQHHYSASLESLRRYIQHDQGDV